MQLNRQSQLDELRKILRDQMETLISSHSWKSFDKEMQTVIEIHKETSLQFLSKDKIKDAERQAWIIEGILECLDRPTDIIQEYDSFTNKFRRKACALCGNIMTISKDFVSQDKNTNDKNTGG